MYLQHFDRWLASKRAVIVVISEGSRSFLRGGFAWGGEWGGNHDDTGHLRGERREATTHLLSTYYGLGLAHESGASYMSNYNLTIPQRGVAQHPAYVSPPTPTPPPPPEETGA